MQGKSDRSNGYTIIEVLIAIIILSVAIMAWMSTQQSAVMGRGQSRTMTVAAELVQAKTEELSVSPAEVCDPDDSCSGQENPVIGGFEYTLTWNLARSLLEDEDENIIPDSRPFWEIEVQAAWNYRGNKNFTSTRIVMER